MTDKDHNKNALVPLEQDQGIGLRLARTRW